MVTQGDLWLMETPNAKSRPVLVVTRSEVISVLNSVVVAPVTSTLRSIATCISVDADHGIDREGVASFDNLATVPKSVLTRRLGTLGPGGRAQICAALAALSDC